MTRENKVALVIGFALVLFVGILISDHLSRAQTQRSANLVQTVNSRAARSAPPARFVDLRTELPTRPVPVVPPPPASQPTTRSVRTTPAVSASVEPAPVEPAATRTRQVRAGESLSMICQQVYGTASLTAALAAHNGIDDPDTVWAGRLLSVPDVRVLTGGDVPEAIPGGAEAPQWTTYRIRKGETLSEVARRFMGSAGRWRELYELNRNAISNPDNIRVGTELRIPAG